MIFVGSVVVSSVVMGSGVVVSVVVVVVVVAGVVVVGGARMREKLGLRQLARIGDKTTFTGSKSEDISSVRKKYTIRISSLNNEYSNIPVHKITMHTVYGLVQTALKI